MKAKLIFPLISFARSYLLSWSTFPTARTPVAPFGYLTRSIVTLRFSLDRSSWFPLTPVEISQSLFTIEMKIDYDTQYQKHIIPVKLSRSRTIQEFSITSFLIIELLGAAWTVFRIHIATSSSSEGVFRTSLTWTFLLISFTIFTWFPVHTWHYNRSTLPIATLGNSPDLPDWADWVVRIAADRQLPPWGTHAKR